MNPFFSKRRFLAPEVVQTSAMDCGPASLKCLLEGFGAPVSYGRLREACQTDVDGTSIDTMEEVAAQLGLEAEQVMAPADHLLLSESESLPAIVIVRLANGLTHFLVVWRTHGRYVQVMDPGMGRRWMSREQLISELYIHTATIPASAWREWAAIAWKQIAGIFSAAAREQVSGSPDFVAFPTSVDEFSAESGGGRHSIDEPFGAARGNERHSIDRSLDVLIEAHDLTFRYRDRGEPALRGCNLRIRAGDRLLLEGDSGGGKSTLASLLTGLRPPESGLLLLGGLDRQTIGTARWRKRVASAPQFHENHVLTGTFAFNLLMGRRWPPSENDMVEAEGVCRA